MERLPQPHPSQAAAHLLALTSRSDGSGLAITLDVKGKLVVRVGDTGLVAKHGPPVEHACGHLSIKQWHHISVTHTKAKVFSPSEMRVRLDYVDVLTATVPVPRVVAQPMDLCVIGANLDGQMSEVRFRGI